MKTTGLVILLASFCLEASAQTYAVLHTFGAQALNPSTGSYTNNDGAYPTAELIASGQTLFGVTSGGGSGGSGTIFKMNFDGSGFTLLHTFAAGTTNGVNTFTNADGQQPQANLLLSDDTLYGTAQYGGTLGGGTLFRINTNGGGFAVVKSFPSGGSSGANPAGGVVVPNGETIYGTTSRGGSAGGSGAGVIFKVDTNGNNYSVIHNFDFSTTNGSEPLGTLLRNGNTIYGTTILGGTAGSGTVFKMNTNGTGFTLLKSFSAIIAGTNSDGAQPQARLILSGGVLYGTTTVGGPTSNGVVFRVDTDGSNFTNLHSFSATTNIFGSQTNADGAKPVSRLVLAGALYGTTALGGDGFGTIFSVNTDGSNFLAVHIFGLVDLSHDGNAPAAGLVLSGATLFGVTQFGGSNLSGTIFRYQRDNTPLVNIARSGANVLLSWQTDAPQTNNFSFTLESTPQLGAGASWNAVSPDAIIVNSQNTVTNPVTGTAQYYRLSPY